MAKQMRTFAWRIESCPLESAAHNVINSGRTGEAAKGCPDPDEQPSTAALWPTVTQVCGECLADICGDRQYPIPPTLASHKQFPAVPVQVIQYEGNHLPGSETKTSQQQENRVIAPTETGTTITGRQHKLNLHGLERLGHTRQSPLRHRRHTPG